MNERGVVASAAEADDGSMFSGFNNGEGAYLCRNLNAKPVPAPM